MRSTIWKKSSFFSNLIFSFLHNKSAIRKPTIKIKLKDQQLINSCQTKVYKEDRCESDMLIITPLTELCPALYHTSIKQFKKDQYLYGLKPISYTMCTSQIDSAFPELKFLSSGLYFGGGGESQHFESWTRNN